VLTSDNRDLSTLRETATTDADWARFLTQFERHFSRLQRLVGEIYGADLRAEDALNGMVEDLARQWQSRPAALKALDERRLAEPDWFQSQHMVGGVCYVDRYAGNLAGVSRSIPYLTELGITYLHLMPLFLAPAGNSDGGYAVSSYRTVDPPLGTVAELAGLAGNLQANSISLVLDFVLNHTSNEHEWARRARAGEAEFEAYYLLFPDRTQPDAYELTTREVFPDDHPGSFVMLDDGRWVWSTFHSFQWDLNYSNPAVLRAMLGEMLFLANQGVEVFRMDAVAFLWKELGTTSENRPQAHLLLQALNAACAIAAPGVLFKSEAIVHPDDVVAYIRPDECTLSYNPLQMALLWSALATRDVALLTQALATRNALPPGTSWVNYVRGHDDIGWTFADQDASQLGIDGGEHRRFLNSFYAGSFPGSFARGVPFQVNPRTGDARVAGTTASLAGLEAGEPWSIERIVLMHSVILSTGGIPLLYLGDEVGQLNDYGYLDVPGQRDDSRWAGRPRYPAARYAERNDRSTDTGRLYGRIAGLIATRKTTPEFADGRLVEFTTGNAGILGYQRPAADGSSLVLVLANFSEAPRSVSALTLSGMPAGGMDIVAGEAVDVSAGLTLSPYEFRWLRFHRA